MIIEVRSARYRTSEAGLTLLELLVTFAVVAILAASAAPAFNELIASSRVKATSDSLIRALYSARAEAIKRGHRVVTCLSASGASCSSSSARKLLIFSDLDKNGSPTASEKVIAIVDIESSSIQISYNRPFLAYTSTGYAAGTNGTFTLCDASGAGQFVIVSSLGRVRKGRDYDGDGFVEKSPGVPISC